MNRREAEKMTREATWRVCMLGQFPTGSAELAAILDELNAHGWTFLREHVAGFDGLTVKVDGVPSYYCAAPRTRKPGKKQTCTLYPLADVHAYADACDALARGEFATAQRIYDCMQSAGLKSLLFEGLERLYVELGQSEVCAQMDAPASDLDMVREVFAGYGLRIEQKRPGCCIFVSGDTKPHKDELKALGFRWAPKKSAWYWKPAA